MHVLITLSGYQERSLFPYPGDYFEFLKILVRSKKSGAVDVYAFSLMPDYVRIVARFRRGEDIRALIRLLNQSYHAHLMATYAVSGRSMKNHVPVPLKSAADLARAIAAVEHDPVAAGLVQSEGEYPYSSAYNRGGCEQILEKVC